MPLPLPINLPEWLNENSHLLKPPVNNYCCFRGGATVMIVGGPNQRTDYHVNETPEYFYMYKGDMRLKVVDDGKFRDIPIREGELYLLPGNTPHCPVRFADTVGIVVEQDRPENSVGSDELRPVVVNLVDRIRWYCENCKEIVYEEAFHMTDLGTQVASAVENFRNNEDLRRCKNCGTIAVTK